jgi:hypothetical protein
MTSGNAKPYNMYGFARLVLFKLRSLLVDTVNINVSAGQGHQATGFVLLSNVENVHTETGAFCNQGNCFLSPTPLFISYDGNKARLVLNFALTNDLLLSSGMKSRSFKTPDPWLRTLANRNDRLGSRFMIGEFAGV